MKYLYTIFLCLILSGCFWDSKIIHHKVLVPVPCKVVLPQKPLMPFTDTSTLEEDIFTKTKKMLAELTVRNAYEEQLESVARSCE